MRWMRSNKLKSNSDKMEVLLEGIQFNSTKWYYTMLDGCTPSERMLLQFGDTVRFSIVSGQSDGNGSQQYLLPCSASMATVFFSFKRWISPQLLMHWFRGSPEMAASNWCLGEPFNQHPIATPILKGFFFGRCIESEAIISSFSTHYFIKYTGKATIVTSAVTQ